MTGRPTKRRAMKMLSATYGCRRSPAMLCVALIAILLLISCCSPTTAIEVETEEQESLSESIKQRLEATAALPGDGWEGPGIETVTKAPTVAGLLGLYSQSTSTNCPVFTAFFKVNNNDVQWKAEVYGFATAQALLAQEVAKGYRLLDLSARIDGAKVYYTLVFEKIAAIEQVLVKSIGFSAFTSDWATRSSNGARLFRLAVYVYNNQVEYIAYYRKGSNQNYALYQFDTKTALTTAIANQKINGNYLVDFESFLYGSKRYYTVVFLGGIAQTYLEFDLSRSTFLSKYDTHYAVPRRLIDFNVYDGLYAGIFTAGSGGYGAWIGQETESMQARDYLFSSVNVRMLGIRAQNGFCNAKCCNDIVGTKYNYGITGEGNVYRWPVLVDKYAKIDHIFFPNPGFYLPFSDTGVSQSSGWRYTSNGAAANYHYALDFAKGGDKSFLVKASLGGKVTFAGWDRWSGNTIVIDHNNGFRTIYMHLRNGKDNDCNKARTETLPNMALNDDRDEYIAHLKLSGCLTNNNIPAPQEKYWGTNSNTMRVKAGDNVSRGTILADAGNTGPGGKRGDAVNPNIHLHIFYVRQDAATKEYFFIDPYGVYAARVSGANCYPSSILGPLTACSRYSVGWKLSAGKLMYA